MGKLIIRICLCALISLSLCANAFSNEDTVDNVITYISTVHLMLVTVHDSLRHETVQLEKGVLFDVKTHDMKTLNGDVYVGVCTANAFATLTNPCNFYEIPGLNQDDIKKEVINTPFNLTNERIWKIDLFLTVDQKGAVIPVMTLASQHVFSNAQSIFIMAKYNGTWVGTRLSPLPFYTTIGRINTSPVLKNGVLEALKVVYEAQVTRNGNWSVYGIDINIVPSWKVNNPVLLTGNHVSSRMTNIRPGNTLVPTSRKPSFDYHKSFYFSTEKSEIYYSPIVNNKPGTPKLITKGILQDAINEKNTLLDGLLSLENSSNEVQLYWLSGSVVIRKHLIAKNTRTGSLFFTGLATLPSQFKKVNGTTSYFDLPVAVGRGGGMFNEFIDLYKVNNRASKKVLTIPAVGMMQEMRMEYLNPVENGKMMAVSNDSLDGPYIEIDAGQDRDVNTWVYEGINAKLTIDGEAVPPEEADVQWEVIGGASPYIHDPNSLETVVLFFEAGVYELEVTANVSTENGVEVVRDVVKFTAGN